MKNLLFIAFLLLLAAPRAGAQVTCDPVFPSVDDDVTIYYDAAQGNGALNGVSPVYAHMGVITDKSQSPTDWKYVVTTWGASNAASTMTQEAPNIWKKSFNIRGFFNIPPGETVLRLAFVFRNANGSIVGRAADGSDMYYDVYPTDGPLVTRFVSPGTAFFTPAPGQPIAVVGAASRSADLQITDNGAVVATGSGKSLQTNLTAGAGLHTIVLSADDGQENASSSFQYLIPNGQPVEDPPAGTELGIQYLSNTSVRLSLYAPDKQVVYVLGDFNNWQFDNNFQMRRSTDGARWWLDITGLQPGQPYRFQYFVDGLRIADPLSTLVLDPGNDPFIPAVTYPDLIPYPSGLTTGLVSVLQTARPPFNWAAVNYQRPKKTDLIVYELLLRDFIARHDFQTLRDTLDYLERLGVTAVELMPVSEFGGNLSWGYNPSFHKALDKYYGTEEELKRLVDECHLRGMAVILDVVYNHVTGESPHASLYWDAANDRPAADNPWLNPVPKHDFNVFYDYNHESAATKEYVKNTLRYWIEEFRIDGFRFDLSKGFTQRATLGNVGAWGAYDAGRIATWKDYAGFIWGIDPENYVILEHFADNTEEKELAEYGMMLWGNAWGGYKEAALGLSFGSNSSMSNVDYQKRGWSVPHVVGYMESHDEDRIAYECLTYGNSANPVHNVRSLPVALRRMEALQNLLYTVPGPKMMWQFGELGYDFPINYCPNGTIDQGCRTAEKPIRWDYPLDPYRRRLYDVTAALLHLRREWDLFETTDYTANIGSGAVRTISLNSPALNQRAFVLVNLDLNDRSTFQTMPATGWWYEYYTGDSILVGGGGPVPFTLKPAEYRLYTNRKVPLPAGLNPTPALEVPGPIAGAELFPNPAADAAYADVHLLEKTGLNVRMSDALGRTLQTVFTGELPEGTSRLSLSLVGLNNGLYFVHFQTENGSVMTKRLLVDRR